MHRPNLRLPAALLSAALLVAAAPAAMAQDASEREEAPRSTAATTLRVLAGGFTGLVAHETGHIITGLIVDAGPGFKRLDYGVIPFFAVTHEPVSRGREFAISVSGFTVQHAVNEWLLSQGPPLRDRSRPFLKGWFAFNVATSSLYAVSAFARTGPPERDTRGIAISVGKSGIPEPVVGTFVLVPAVLDGVRYLRDDPAWARWTSRAAKVGLVLLAIR